MFAFAYAIGRYLPGLAVPMRLLAGGVSDFRVHYPRDVVIGSIVGAGTAATVAAACDHLLPTARIGRLWPEVTAASPIMKRR